MKEVPAGISLDPHWGIGKSIGIEPIVGLVAQGRDGAVEGIVGAAGAGIVRCNGLHGVGTVPAGEFEVEVASSGKKSAAANRHGYSCLEGGDTGNSPSVRQSAGDRPEGSKPAYGRQVIGIAKDK